jgi:hypothetical protein
MSLNPSPQSPWSRIGSRRSTFLFGGIAAIATLLLASATWAFEDAEEEAEEVGIRGIFAFEAPDDLSEESLATFEGNWKDWGAELAAEVLALYEGEDLDIPAQRKAIAGLKSKIDRMDQALADARYRSIHDNLVNVRGRVARRVEMAEAILDTLELDPEAVKNEKIAAARTAVSAAVANLKKDLGAIRNGKVWLPYVHAAELTAAASSNEKAIAADNLLKKVQGKFAGRKKLEKAQQEFLGRQAFENLHAAVNGLAASLNIKPRKSDPEQLRAQLAELIEAIEEYEEDNSSEAAQAASAALESLKKNTVDGGDRISAVMRSYYINYNLQIAISESFLNRVVREQHKEDSRVRDNVLGASVSGTQSTTATLGIDFKPSNDQARFDVTLDGVTRSNTTGVTSQATIYTSGYHTFRAAKEVSFDGERFLVRDARISVNANNTTTGARTGASGIPLFGGIARGIAMREARRRSGQSESITRTKIRQKVLPKFNDEIEERFETANTEIDNDVNKRLKSAGVFPSATGYKTTDKMLRLSMRVSNETELAGGVPSSALTPSTGLTLHIHESLLNNSVDRMKIAGRTMTEADLKKELEAFLSKLLARDFTFDDKEAAKTSDDKDPTILVFAKSNPLRFRFDDGTISLIIRAGLKREGEDDIPTQIVTVPLTFNITKENILVKRGDVKVAPAKRPDSLAKQVVRAGVMRKKIESAIADRKDDKSVTIERPDREDIVVTVATIKALNGWLTISVR